MPLPAVTVDEKQLADTIRRAPAGDLYVFGYGSLMWRPGFAYKEALPARVFGYCRRCAVYSNHYRGTPARPGLVLGLDAGGSCNGMVYRAPAAKKAQIIRYLFKREMFAQVYVPRYVSVACGRGRRRALTFIVRRECGQYAAPMPDAQAAAIIRRARGSGGSNRDYFINTHNRLHQMGMRCPMVERLCELLAE